VANRRSAGGPSSACVGAGAPVGTMGAAARCVGEGRGRCRRAAQCVGGGRGREMRGGGQGVVGWVTGDGEADPRKK
jgi:hypothetical protein